MDLKHLTDEHCAGYHTSVLQAGKCFPASEIWLLSLTTSVKMPEINLKILVS